MYTKIINKRKKGILIFSLITLLTGCEAPLNLEGVDQERNKSVRRTDQLLGVAVSKDNVIVVGSDGVVLTSPVNELNWQRQELKNKPNFVDIETCPDSSLIALSMESQLWTSHDQGQSWQSSDIPTPESLITVTCGPDNSYWATGSFSTLMSSQDQGKSWNELSLNEDAAIASLQFLDNQNLIATGEFGLLARSEDGGQNWTLLDPIPNEFFPMTSYFSDSATGWVAGLGGIILTTTDGGLSWQKQATPTESPIYNFYVSGSRLFAFGDHGTVLEQQNGNWVRLDAPKIPVYLRDGKQLDAKRLLVSGGWGSLFTVDI